MKRALLIGINSYPDNPLEGCVADALLMKTILAGIYGYDQIRMLLDFQATHSNIIEDLEWLVDGAERGDELVFFNSSHGSHVPVTDRTASSELDGWDECIVPIDHSWDRPLRDADLHDILMPTLDKGAKLLVILDNCFSGTGFRGCKGPTQKIRTKFLPPPAEWLLKNMKISLKGLDLNVTHDHPDPNSRLYPFLIDTVEQGDALLISACRDDQTSADASFGRAGAHGVLTFYMAQTLQENDWNITYRDLITKINEKMVINEFDQTPQLEGKAKRFDTLFLGGTLTE